MTPTPSPNYATLLIILDHEISALRLFVTTLQEEQQLLARSTDVSTLPDLVARKTELYRQLTDLGRQRTSWFVAGSLSGMQALLDRIREAEPAVHAEIAEKWETLLGLARTARASNETNGRLVRTRMVYNRSALDAIRMASGTMAPSTYGSDGRMG
ncbi:flagella synthesis protein FlgN [Robbsia andropogonis]|uniref:flagella synthesis protein FlgN n=1 Tax=Robbsia andropogonis TaxID=28092 RepID=UPI000464EA35|nr:flagellar protein FlgN [Robbsia andropogonis]MCP1118747.1 flagellar protein FlgN [Robbsia andropogonis]MCP1128214.1 flagellar protein FlgN [Robbsia andropogonis]